MGPAVNVRGSCLLSFDVDARRAVSRPDALPDHAPLAALADSLARDLERLIDAPLPIPEHKARLTRIGGRCPLHGTLLEFDPWHAHDHWCARCARAYTGREHDEWWAMGAQLWTSERAVHAASLFVVRGDPRHAALAERILNEYTNRYHSWPNRDNVLGPTRLFFSTYLESIWLLNICHAVALLEGSDSAWRVTDASAIRDRVLEPSASLIASYPEGASNRQVWNEVAIGSAWRLLGRDDDVRGRLDREGGIRWQMANGLDDAGSWYEGENYHLFAHRGLWYGAELLRVLGEPLSATLNARYSAGFVAPFAGLLPDETFPSRRDSQYASSIRQWRTAEWCELGWTHTRDARIAGVLTRLYDGRTPRRDTGRSVSTADAERNTSATSLTRADLSWRALLMADQPPPPSEAEPLGSVCRPGQGLAVIRRDAGRTYVALEGGQLGGGHGHPDQLALTLQTGAARWLDDPGTGSYVETTLRWYRSTMAHAAPLFDRTSQGPVSATLVAFDDQDSAGWMVKRIEDHARGITVERTIVVCDGYLVDVVEWASKESHVFELPIAGRADVAGSDNTWSELPSEDPRPDGIDAFTETTTRMPLWGLAELKALAACAEIAPTAVASDAARVWYVVQGTVDHGAIPAWIVRATVPAAPAHGRTVRHWLRAHGACGRVIGVWSWPSDRWPAGAVSSVQVRPGDVPHVEVYMHDGTTARHSRQGTGWHVAHETPRGLHRVELTGRREVPPTPAEKSFTIPRASPLDIVVPFVITENAAGLPGSRIEGAHTVVLGEAHYVPTEQPWREAGRPGATVQLAATSRWLVVDIHAATGPLVVAPANAVNALDNEPADINADGVQWYIAPTTCATSASPVWTAAALHVPSSSPLDGPQGRESRIAGSFTSPKVEWCEVSGGWAMRLRWEISALPVDADRALWFELVINERPPDRERRRGQLVMSGGGGFGYLMGDRRPADRGVRLVLPLSPAETTLR